MKPFAKIVLVSTLVERFELNDFSFHMIICSWPFTIPRTTIVGDRTFQGVLKFPMMIVTLVENAHLQCDKSILMALNRQFHQDLD